jgi:hypothetical protein
MRVYFGRLDTFMPHQFLNVPQVHAVFHQVRRKRMAQ